MSGAENPGPFTITKTSHSRNPWRITDANGTTISFEIDEIEIHGSAHRLTRQGYPTKAAAVEALGRLAGELLRRLNEGRWS